LNLNLNLKLIFRPVERLKFKLNLNSKLIFRPVERLIFLVVLTHVVDYFNRALMRQFDRSVYVVH